MPAAAGGVTDLEVEDGVFGVVGRSWTCPYGFVEDRVKCGIEQTLDEAVRRVIAACRLALMTARRLEFKRSRVEVQIGVVTG